MQFGEYGSLLINMFTVSFSANLAALLHELGSGGEELETEIGTGRTVSAFAFTAKNPLL